MHCSVFGLLKTSELSLFFLGVKDSVPLEFLANRFLAMKSRVIYKIAFLIIHEFEPYNVFRRQLFDKGVDLKTFKYLVNSRILIHCKCLSKINTICWIMFIGLCLTQISYILSVCVYCICMCVNTHIVYIHCIYWICMCVNTHFGYIYIVAVSVLRRPTLIHMSSEYLVYIKGSGRKIALFLRCLFQRNLKYFLH